MRDQLEQFVPLSIAQDLRIEATAVSPTNDSNPRLVGLTRCACVAWVTCRLASCCFALSDTAPLTLLLLCSMVPSTSKTVFSDMQLQAVPGDVFKLLLSVPALPQVQPAELFVRMGPCSAGQAPRTDPSSGQLSGCDTCSNLQFSFNSSAPEGCQPCLPEGWEECSKSVLLPANGSYHTHPRSMQLHACSYEPACSRGPQQLELMRAIQAKAALPGANALPAEDVAAYQALQCSQGYQGLLCNSCVNKHGTYADGGTKRYGRWWFRCAPCAASRATSIALYVLIRLFDLGVQGELPAYELSACERSASCQPSHTLLPSQGCSCSSSERSATNGSASCRCMVPQASDCLGGVRFACSS